MKIWYGSDLHTDFWDGENITKFVKKDYDLYIFAGDLSEWRGGDSKKKVFNHLEDKRVIWVPGNHEFYQGEFYSVLDDALSYDSENRTCLKDGFIDFPEEGIRIFGSTFWTDFGGDPRNMEVAKAYMNDYRMIMESKPGSVLFETESALREHFSAREALKKAWRTLPEGYRMIVVSHHAPSFRSISKKHRRPGYMELSRLNNAYASNLEDWLKEEGIFPSAWIHGHIHERVCYDLDGMLVVSNPFGYPGENLGIKENFGKRFLEVGEEIEAKYEN